MKGSGICDAIFLVDCHWWLRAASKRSSFLISHHLQISSLRLDPIDPHRSRSTPGSSGRICSPMDIHSSTSVITSSETPVFRFDVKIIHLAAFWTDPIAITFVIKDGVANAAAWSFWSSPVAHSKTSIASLSGSRYSSMVMDGTRLIRSFPLEQTTLSTSNSTGI